LAKGEVRKLKWPNERIVSGEEVLIRIKSDDEVIEVSNVLPLLPLRDVVVFPSIVIPLMVGRRGSVSAVDAAMSKDRIIFLVAQRRAETARPKEK